MATVENITVDQNSGRVTIEKVTINDENLTEYISGFSASDREDALVQALRVGASALNLADTTKEAEYVERRFEEMERQFEGELQDLHDELDDRFGDDGDLSRILDENLGEDGKLVAHFEETFGEEGRFAERLDEELGQGGEKIREALDPNNPETPTHELKQQIGDLRDRLISEEAREEVREKTTLKGYDFEEQVEKLLGELVNYTSNQVENTSEQAGELSNNLKGDFVVTLGETGQRIVVEAKNGRFNETANSEMNEAIENRNADYGLLVASSLEYLPRTEVGWFSEIEQDYAVVALSETPSDDIEPRFLKFAFHWARTRTLLSSVELSDTTDPEAIKSELDGLKGSIDDFSKIRSQCTDLEKSESNIRTHLTDIEDDVMSRITRIENELGTSAD